MAEPQSSTPSIYLEMRQKRKRTMRKMAALTRKLAALSKKYDFCTDEMIGHRRQLDASETSYSNTIQAAKRAELLRLAAIDPTDIEAAWVPVAREHRDISKDIPDCSNGSDCPTEGDGCAYVYYSIFQKWEVHSKTRLCHACLDTVSERAARLEMAKRNYLLHKLTKPYACGLTIEQLLPSEKSD